MIARADGVTSSRGTMPNGLGTLHAARPIRPPFGRGARRRRGGVATSAERSRCATQRAHCSRATRLRNASNASASIGGGRSTQDGTPAARGPSNRAASETGTAGG